MIIMIYVKKKKKKREKKLTNYTKMQTSVTIYDFTKTPLLPNKPPAGIKCHKKGIIMPKKKKAVVMTTAYSLVKAWVLATPFWSDHCCVHKRRVKRLNIYLAL